MTAISRAGIGGDFSLQNIADKVLKAYDKVATFALSFFQNTLLVIKEGVSHSSTFATVIRKFDKNLLAIIETYRNVPGYFDKFRETLKDTVGILDFLLIVGDINYFFTTKFWKDSALEIAKNVSLTVVDFGGALLWLEDLGFFDLSKAAQKLGEVKLFSYAPAVIAKIPVLKKVEWLGRAAEKLGQVKVFSILTKIRLEKVVDGALYFGYGFLTLSAFQKAVESQDKEHTFRAAAIECAYYAAELATSILIGVGLTNVFGLGALAATCVALSVAKLAYTAINRAELMIENPTPVNA